MAEQGMAKTIFGTTAGVIIAIVVLVFMLCSCFSMFIIFAALSARPY